MPAPDALSLLDAAVAALELVAPDARGFQHIARFYNYLGQLIVTAAVYRGLVSVLRRPKPTNTST